MRNKRSCPGQIQLTKFDLSDLSIIVSSLAMARERLFQMKYKKMQQKNLIRLVRNILGCLGQIQLAKSDLSDLSILLSSLEMTRSLKRKTLLTEIDWDLCSLGIWEPLHS